MNRVLLFISIVLIGLCTFLFYQNQNLKEDKSVAYNNIKAFIAENSSLKENNRVFLLTIDQLQSYNDSIMIKMNQTLKELKVKNSEVKQLQYKLSSLSKKDTIILRDTIFKEPDFRLDTLFGDKWVRERLLLEYPNKVARELEVVLDNYVIVKETKETIKPRKKFFLCRWFQRKHKVREVIIHENNPYVRDSISRFVEIIK